MGNKLLRLILGFLLILILSNWAGQGNKAPIVKISSPDENVKLKWNSIIPYSINVTDKEDGSSEYDEIDPGEVILSVVYLPDSADAKKNVEDIGRRSETLSLMASSKCLICHGGKNRIIGPSFEEIAMRYKPIIENMEYLTQKIRAGSSGVWGEQIMPGQPELDTEKIAQMLDWIFKNAQDPNYTFLTGIRSAFKTKKRATDNSEKAAYLLHAQYVDHGLTNSSETSKKGMHTIVLPIE